MQKDKLTHVLMISRVLLGFLFIYHGLVPKILWLSVVEIHLVSISGIGVPAKIASPLAGIGEIVLGCAIIFLNKSNTPVYIATTVLLLLLFFVAVASPVYLIGAFNPVTTNILGLGFCYFILFASEHEKS